MTSSNLAKITISKSIEEFVDNSVSVDRYYVNEHLSEFGPDWNQGSMDQHGPFSTAESAIEYAEKLADELTNSDYEVDISLSILDDDEETANDFSILSAAFGNYNE